MTNSKLVVLVSLFLVLFGNVSFFKKVTDVYVLSMGNIAFLGSLAILLTSLIVLLLTLITTSHTTKPILILVLLVSSLASYFMDSYGAVIDYTMIQNIVQTNIGESIDLFSFKLVLYFLFLGVLPSAFIYQITIQNGSVKTELVSKSKVIVVTLLIMACMVFLFSSFYA